MAQDLIQLKQLHFISVKQNSTVACGSARLKSIFSDCPEHFINRKVCGVVFNKIVFFGKNNNNYSINSTLWNVITFFFRCNQTCYCAGMVSVTSASHYQSRALMYIRGLIEAFPIVCIIYSIAIILIAEWVGWFALITFVLLCLLLFWLSTEFRQLENFSSIRESCLRCM